MKVMLAGSNVIVGALTDELIVKIATQFAAGKYPGKLKFLNVTEKNGLKVAMFLKPGSGDLNPTLTVGIVVDADGKIVKDVAAQDDESVMDFLFPSASHVW